MKLNKEYKKLAENILNNENFLALKNDIHHGSTRYDHCNRVAYISYLIAKMTKCDYESVVVSGLLHDFFYGHTNIEANSYVNHPLTSVNNAKKYFQINDFEASIIETHMYHYIFVKNCFPFINKKEKVDAKKYKPKSKEGKIVCLADLLVSIFECGIFKVRYSICLYLLFFINIVRY